MWLGNNEKSLLRHHIRQPSGHLN